MFQCPIPSEVRIASSILHILFHRRCTLPPISKYGCKLKIVGFAEAQAARRGPMTAVGSLFCSVFFMSTCQRRMTYKSASERERNFLDFVDSKYMIHILASFASCTCHLLRPGRSNIHEDLVLRRRLLDAIVRYLRCDLKDD